MSRNRYVGDYRIVERLDERGRVRSESEYIGDHYRYAEDAATVRSARLTVTVCCALGWAAYLLALMPKSLATRTMYTSLPFIFAAIPLGLTTGTAASLYTEKVPFRHKHADRLENRAPAGTFFMMALAAIAMIGEAVNLMRGLALAGGDGLFCLGAVILFVCGFMSHRQWKRLKCSVNDAF